MSDLLCTLHTRIADPRSSCELCATPLCPSCLAHTQPTSQVRFPLCPNCFALVLRGGAVIEIVPVWVHKSAGPFARPGAPERNYIEKVYLSEAAAIATVPESQEIQQGHAIRKTTPQGIVLWLPLQQGDAYPGGWRGVPRAVDVHTDPATPGILGERVRELQARQVYQAEACLHLLREASDWVLSFPDRVPEFHDEWLQFKREHGGCNPILCNEKAHVVSSRDRVRFLRSCSSAALAKWHAGLRLLRGHETGQLTVMDDICLRNQWKETQAQYPQCPDWQWSREHMLVVSRLHKIKLPVFSSTGQSDT